jgi:hypothetical protein
MAKTYQKWMVGTAAAVIVLGSLSFPQVQATASEVLSMFRAEKFETIRMTEQDLNEMQSWLSNGSAGVRDLKGIGKMEKIDSSSGPRYFDSKEFAKNEGYEVAPAPAGFSFASLSVNPQFTMEITLNTEKANNMLKMLGSQVFFDDKINEKPFTVTFPRETETRFISQEQNGLSFSYTVLNTPQLTAPQGVDLGELRTTLLQMPFIPQNIAMQLAQIEDWQNTIPLPYVEGDKNFTEVTVNGAKGVFQSNNSNTYGFIMWQKGGKMHRLNLWNDKQPVADLKSLLLELAKTYN